MNFMHSEDEIDRIHEVAVLREQIDGFEPLAAAKELWRALEEMVTLSEEGSLGSDEDSRIDAVVRTLLKYKPIVD